MLSQKYGLKRVTTDAGVALNCQLLEQRPVDEISLVVSPVVVGKIAVNLFGKLHSYKGGLELEMVKREVMENDCFWVLYRVK